MLARLLLVVILTQQGASGWLYSEKCYDELPEEFNCFGLKTPYTNTFFHKPKSPTEQDIQFKLYLGPSPTPTQLLSVDAGPPAEFAGYSGKVAFIIHGFTDSTDSHWVTDMADALLDRSEIGRVVLVNWAKGAKGPNYYQAAANTRVVGALLAVLIKTLEVDPAAVHLVGHSLGAQIAGYAGEKFGSRYPTFHNTPLGRITGLDPAAPKFENYAIEVRLDPTDATFVDVIHTDTTPLHQGGLGMVKLCGHVDFMPNGGHDQPGCPEDKINLANLGNIENIGESVACSHSRAPVFFTASIIDADLYPACLCSEEDNKNDACAPAPCPEGVATNRMGYHATDSPTGLFYLTTDTP